MWLHLFRWVKEKLKFLIALSTPQGAEYSGGRTDFKDISGTSMCEYNLGLNKQRIEITKKILNCKGIKFWKSLLTAGIIAAQNREKSKLKRELRAWWLLTEQTELSDQRGSAKSYIWWSENHLRRPYPVDLQRQRRWKLSLSLFRAKCGMMSLSNSIFIAKESRSSSCRNTQSCGRMDWKSYLS